MSDIDALIFLYRIGNLKSQAEIEALQNESRILLSVQQLGTLREARRRIYEGGSWSTWITLVVGSKVIYRTKKFDAFRRSLGKQRLSPKRLINYLKGKDRFELDGYVGSASGWELTKGLFSHMRRKLQIISYYRGNKLAFEFDVCLNNLSDLNTGVLRKLRESYMARKSISAIDIPVYMAYARELTGLAIDSIKKT